MTLLSQMSQLEFYKSFQFILELLIAETLFSLRLARRNFFALRAVFGIGSVFLVSYLFPVAFENAFFISFMFFALFAYTVLVAKFLFRESMLKIIFCCIAGYTVQHLAYELHNLALVVMGVQKSMPMGMYGSGEFVLFPNAFLAIIYFYIFFVTYFFAKLIFGNRIKTGEKLQLKSGFMFIFAFIILAVDIILNAFVVYRLSGNGNSDILVIVGLYNILCCVLALILQFEVSLRYKLEDSLNAIAILHHKEKAQYRQLKENIEIINRKCHDLKHQIRNIGNRSSISEESINEIESAVTIYDSTVITGNEALDIILTEKRLQCTQTGIKFSCIADGERLSFMQEDDIYSLFGNLIDNAIEAVQDVEDGKRVIGLKIKAIGSILSVNVHNYYEKTLVFEDGMPKTTKPEKDYHGYGLKSVKYVCDKYDGDLSINTENNVFSINIMFPLK